MVFYKSFEIRPDIAPHKIDHGFKYQSRKDFEEPAKRNKLKKEENSPLPPPPPPYIPKSSKLFSGSYDPDHSPYQSPSNVEAQRPVKDRRCCNGNTIIINVCTGWGALGLIVLLALIIVPIVVTRIPKHSGPPPASNVTATTTTVIIVSSQATTFTLTQASTVVVIQTPTASTSTLSSTPQSTIIPGPAAGFVSHGWSNGNIQLFYQDPSASPGTIYSVQIISDVWSTPVAIATDAMPGSSLSLSRVEYDLDTTDTDITTASLADDITIWRVAYVDKNNILQAVEKTVQFDPDVQDDSVEVTAIAGASGWYAGNLGSYHFKVASTLYHQACTWGSADYYYTDSNKDTYIYFDSASGGIKKIGYVESTNTWTELSDMPSAFGTSGLAMECTETSASAESVWFIDSKNHLQQYYYFKSGSTYGLAWTAGATYTGPIAKNSSLAKLDQWGYSTLFFQTPDGSIMQIPITSSSFPSTTGDPELVAVGQLGTRLTAAGDQSGAVGTATGGHSSSTYGYSIFYQSGNHILRQSGTNNVSVNVGSGVHSSPKSAAFRSGVFLPGLLLPFLALSLLSFF